MWWLASWWEETQLLFNCGKSVTTTSKSHNINIYVIDKSTAATTNTEPTTSESTMVVKQRRSRKSSSKSNQLTCIISPFDEAPPPPQPCDDLPPPKPRRRERRASLKKSKFEPVYPDPPMATVPHVPTMVSLQESEDVESEISLEDILCIEQSDDRTLTPHPSFDQGLAAQELQPSGRDFHYLYEAQLRLENDEWPSDEDGNTVEINPSFCGCKLWTAADEQIRVDNLGDRVNIDDTAFGRDEQNGIRQVGYSIREDKPISNRRTKRGAKISNRIRLV